MNTLTKDYSSMMDAELLETIMTEAHKNLEMMMEDEEFNKPNNNPFSNPYLAENHTEAELWEMYWDFKSDGSYE